MKQIEDMPLRFIGLFSAFLLFTPAVFSQDSKACSSYDSVPPLFVVELDTMWLPGIDKPKMMKQAISFFIIENNMVYTSGVYDFSKFKKKGKVGRWKSSLNTENNCQSNFYMVSRGLGRGSLTVKLTYLANEQVEIHITSAFATFDKIFRGHLVQLSAIDRSVFTTKPKPGKK
ncbi:MAG: hypothetical protein NWR50_03525 [Crocinitomicaceae bacterium]|nr:hypothetical protein [Crocinitomicaceae bacterium]